MDPNEQSINNDGDPNDLERIEFDYDEKDVLQSKGFPWQIADQRSPRWLSRTPLCIALVCHVLLIIILVSVLGVFACNWTRDHLSFGHHLLESQSHLYSIVECDRQTSLTDYPDRSRQRRCEVGEGGS